MFPAPGPSHFLYQSKGLPGNRFVPFYVIGAAEVQRGPDMNQSDAGMGIQHHIRIKTTADRDHAVDIVRQRLPAGHSHLQ